MFDEASAARFEGGQIIEHVVVDDRMAFRPGLLPLSLGHPLGLTYPGRAEVGSLSELGAFG